MSGFLVFDDVNYVRRAFPVSAIGCITLEYNGTSQPAGNPLWQWGRPLIAVYLLNGETVRHVFLPIVDSPKDNEHIEQIVWRFFNNLALGKPVGGFGHPA